MKVETKAILLMATLVVVCILFYTENSFIIYLWIVFSRKHDLLNQMISTDPEKLSDIVIV